MSSMMSINLQTSDPFDTYVNVYKVVDEKAIESDMEILMKGYLDKAKIKNSFTTYEIRDMVKITKNNPILFVFLHGF